MKPIEPGCHVLLLAETKQDLDTDKVAPYTGRRAFIAVEGPSRRLVHGRVGRCNQCRKTEEWWRLDRPEHFACACVLMRIDGDPDESAESQERKLRFDWFAAQYVKASAAAVRVEQSK